MAHLVNKEQCNGCHACFNACPVQAISMLSDEEGFLYPAINENICIECGKCDRSCPIQNPPVQNPLEDAYACYAKNVAEHQTSCSGGAFAVLARQVLRDGGIVAGAAFGPAQEVLHIVIDSERDLWKLKGTKYVQSTIGNCFSHIQECLNQGRTVLFSGTPCQVAGLKSFLREEPENLLTIDLICHGVPSPGIWLRYLNELANGEPIVSVAFRNKTKGTTRVTLDYRTAVGTLIQENYSDSPYIKGFIQNLFVRPSCFCCPFKGTKRCSDFTIGDFWSAKEYHPDMVNEDGVSALIVHSAKAQKLMDRCKSDFVIKVSTVEKATLWNESLIQPAVPSPNREKFFDDVENQCVKDAILNNWIAPAKPPEPSKSRKILSGMKGLIRKWLA